MKREREIERGQHLNMIIAIHCSELNSMIQWHSQRGGGGGGGALGG